MQKKGIMFQLIKGILLAMDEIDNRRASLDDVLDDPEIIMPETRRTSQYWLFSLYRVREDIEKYIDSFAGKGINRNRLFKLSVAVLAHCAFQNSIAREKSVNAFVEFAKKKIGGGEARFLNALLRKFCRENTVFTPRIPQWCRSRWLEWYGADFVEDIEKNVISEPESVFRLRPGFEIKDFKAERIPGGLLDKFDFYYTDQLEKCLRSETFAAGGIYVQDAATGCPLELLSKYIASEHRSIIDVCGAPGGKAVMFYDLFPDWDMTVADISKRRQRRTVQNLKRCGVNAHICCFDCTKYEFKRRYDVVLADVPCSNSGVFRRRPDAFMRLDEATVADVVKVQRDILKNISRAVAVNGLLLYSTCSIEKEEDSLQIADFCREHQEFELLEEKLVLPGKDNDGSYSACLRRIK